LQLSVVDSAGTGFSFVSTSAGAVTTGLEGGGEAGGYSAAEIAEALNAAVAERPDLTAARVRFTVRDGEVAVDGDLDFTLTALDFDRGTGFASGLAGAHRVGGANSADVFGVLARLAESLRANDGEAIARAVGDLQRAVDLVGGAQAFYGGTLRQIDLTLTNLGELRVVNEERLSRHRDADLLDSIARMQQATSAEQFAIQVASRRLPTLLDVLA
jgi:flagellin-like hook-associated protein FlgL